MFKGQLDKRLKVGVTASMLYLSQTSARIGLDSYFKGKSSLGSLMPGSGEASSKIALLASPI